MTEWLHFHFSLSCIGEGNGNPLQCSWLENPRSGGAWWLPSMGLHSQTWLKRLNNSINISHIFLASQYLLNTISNLRKQPSFAGYFYTSVWIPAYVCAVCAQLLSRVQLPWTIAQQAPLSMEFSRQEWSGLPVPSPGDLPNPGIKPKSPASPALAGGFSTTEPPGKLPISSVQSLSCVRLFATPWIAARQASLSITYSRSPLKLMSIESVMPSSHLILCRPLLLLPPIPPSVRVFSNESTLPMRWPKYWSFSFSIIPSKEHPGLISFRMDWLDLLAVQGTLKSLLQHHSSKTSVLWGSAFFTVTGKH